MRISGFIKITQMRKTGIEIKKNFVTWYSHGFHSAIEIKKTEIKTGTRR